MQPLRRTSEGGMSEGKKQSKTTRNLGVFPSTVCRSIKRIQSLEEFYDRAGRGKKPNPFYNRKRTQIRQKVANNPKRSMIEMACSLKMLSLLTGRIVHDHLELSCNCSKLTYRKKKTRVQKARKLFVRINGDELNMTIFKDKEIYNVRKELNIQNQFLLVRTSLETEQDGVIDIQSSIPISSHGVRSCVIDSPLYSVEENVKLNAQKYLENILKGVVKS